MASITGARLIWRVRSSRHNGRIPLSIRFILPNHGGRIVTTATTEAAMERGAEAEAVGPEEVEDGRAVEAGILGAVVTVVGEEDAEASVRMRSRTLMGRRFWSGYRKRRAGVFLK